MQDKANVARVTAVVRDAMEQHKSGAYPAALADVVEYIRDYERRGLYVLADAARRVMRQYGY